MRKMKMKMDWTWRSEECRIVREIGLWKLWREEEDWWRRWGLEMCVLFFPFHQTDCFLSQLQTPRMKFVFSFSFFFFLLLTFIFYFSVQAYDILTSIFYFLIVQRVFFFTSCGVKTWTLVNSISSIELCCYWLSVWTFDFIP